MSRTTKLAIGVIGIIVALIALVLAYIWLTGGSEDATQELIAPTLEINNTSQAETILFTLDKEESSARFTLTEDLRRIHTVVIGTTKEIAGEIFVDFENPANTQIGTIRINVRTLATDEQFRDRAIRGQILRVNEKPDWEFSDFTPTEIQNLPETITFGEPFNVNIIGDLRIRDIVQTVTFEATITPVSETRIEGKASATILREQFDLQIPAASMIANVSEEVTLELEFVAKAAE